MEKKTFKQWCKEHKKGIFAGVILVITAILVYLGLKDGGDPTLHPADHGQFDPDPTPDDDDYYDLEAIDEDIYSDASYDLMNSISDGMKFYKDTRTYEVSKEDSVTVNWTMFRHPTDEPADFTSKVEMISDICPDIETDTIIDFLKECEDTNNETEEATE